MTKRRRLSEIEQTLIDHHLAGDDKAGQQALVDYLRVLMYRERLPERELIARIVKDLGRDWGRSPLSEQLLDIFRRVHERVAELVKLKLGAILMGKLDLAAMPRCSKTRAISISWKRTWPGL
jgi:hypothetical protein